MAWSTRNFRIAGALAGLVSAVVALGVAQLVAVVTGARSAPLATVGSAVIDSTPPAVREFAIATFGTNDKNALVIGTLVLLAGFAAVIGLLAVRDVRLGLAGIAVFGVIGVASALTRAGANLGWALPALLGCMAAAVVLVMLVRTATSAHDQTSVDVQARRRFLWQAVGTGAGALVVGYVGRLVGENRTVAAARNAVASELPTPATQLPGVPAGADFGVAHLTPYVTSNNDFYRIDIDLGFALPQVDPQTWQLRIHGQVRNPLTLTFDDLLKRPMIERYVTLSCVSNPVGGPLISNAKWLGARVQDLLDEADPLPGADQVVSRAPDGFSAGTPTAVLRDGRDALLAIAMNGQPLPIAHGFPVRLVVPGWYGYVSATKWITELELTSFAKYQGYWVQRGWAAQGPVKTESRIDTPRDGARLHRGPVTVAGVAWAVHRGISMVEVQVDDGPWQIAELATAASADTWRQWRYVWTANSGEHRLSVRATDNTGQTQTGAIADVVPDGATGWDAVTVSVS